MNKYSTKLAAALLAATLGTASLPLGGLYAAAASAPLTAQDVQQAIQKLSELRVLQGYEDGSMKAEQRITRAELAKMIVLTFGLNSKAEAGVSFTDVKPQAWYAKYASELVALNIMQAKDGRFDPQGIVSDEELVQTVVQALKRDVKSVQYWAEPFYEEGGQATRGQAAYLLKTARQASPSAEAKVTSIRALNAITLIVTFDAPLTAEDEVFAKAKADFAFNDGLELTNMPRLKTGSIATYIVPTSVQKPGTTYHATYKGKKAGTFSGNAEKPDMTEARQVTNDTFELEALKANGVVDYGYVISAYSGGRGANAFILDENESADGKTYQIISSGQGREVTITPEGGQPIMAKYVPFTQSTDGRQEPKFRLPDGQTLKPGVKYTVTSDWADIAIPTFVAGDVAPPVIAGAEALGEASISVTLAADPGDELFSGRSVRLTDENGNEQIATYKYSSRKGATGVFDLAQGGKLTKGAAYAVTPVGDWAAPSKVELTAK